MSQVTEEDKQGAIRWFIGMGTISILFCFFLVWVDNTLTNSPAEKILGETLYELRSAQTGLNSRPTDDRQLEHFLHAAPANSHEASGH